MTTRIILPVLVCLMALKGQIIAQSEPAPVSVLIKNEEAANTSALEFSPTFFEDGIVFISTNPAVLKKDEVDENQSAMMSILRARRNAEGLLQAPEAFAKELTTLNHEGPICFDRTVETAFFSSNAVENGKDIFAKDKTQKQRLYMSKKVNGVWGKPEALPFNSGEWDDFHPSISIDGDKLFFASNRPGGLGSTDIYVSYKTNDTWSEPVNLGPGVNSKGREAFPFIHADNTLYFASDGLPDGQGGFDLYYAIPEGNSWTKPINMGQPFNSTGDDLGLIVDLNKINGYYSSNGNGGQGGDDIFNFHTENGTLDDFLLQNNRVPARKVDVKIAVTDKKNNAPIGEAAIQILNYDAGNQIGRDDAGNLITIQKVDGQDVIKSMPPDQGINGETDNKGRYEAEVNAGNYAIIVTKKGYQTKQIRMLLSKPGNVVNIQLEKTGAVAGKVQWNPSLFNYMTNAPLSGAMVVVTNERTGQRDTLIADANGQIDHYLDPNTRYKVEMYQGGRLVGTTEVNTEGADPGRPLLQNISLAPLMPGAKIELPNIYYNFNDATLRPDARKDLDLVVALMKQQPTMTVELASHTDCRGSNYYNQELSQRRANGVVEYLVTKGVERSRLRPVGYGESEPRNNCIDGSNCTEQEHGRNRRTEVRIIAGVQGASMIYVDGGITDDPKPQTSTPAPDKPGAKPAKPTKTKTSAGTTANGKVKVTSGDKDVYFVVAGSFLMETRAQTQANKLAESGYTDAQIIQFSGSTFYSVAVGRFTTRQEADQLRNKLAKEKIDAFVRAGL